MAFLRDPWLPPLLPLTLLRCLLLVEAGLEEVELAGEEEAELVQLVLEEEVVEVGEQQKGGTLQG